MSRFVRARPDAPADALAEDRAKPVRGLLALVFACGLVLGAALGGLSWRVFSAPRSARELDPVAAIARVAGMDTAEARSETVVTANLPEPAAAPARKSKLAARARSARQALGPPRVSANEDAVQRVRRPAEIARDALGFTAFIRGGHVYGAGILLDHAGHVLTCRHVITGLPSITVSFSDGSSFPATLVDSDQELDIALLKIAPGRASELTPASVTGVALGDDVFAIGAPRKLAFSLSRGMVSFVGRPFERIYYLQTDLAMNGGSSGGPVMNDRGQVVGLSSFVLRDSEGLAFALPIDYAYRRFREYLQPPAALEGGGGAAFEDWLAALDRDERKTVTSQ